MCFNVHVVRGQLRSGSGGWQGGWKARCWGGTGLSEETGPQWVRSWEEPARNKKRRNVTPRDLTWKGQHKRTVRSVRGSAISQEARSEGGGHTWEQEGWTATPVQQAGLQTFEQTSCRNVQGHSLLSFSPHCLSKYFVKNYIELNSFLSDLTH